MRLADVFVAVRADMTDVNQAFEGLERSLGGVQKSLGNMGAAMTRNVTLPILAVGGATSKMAMDFERTMGQMVGLADVSAGSIDGIREEVMALAQETGRGPQELAEAMYFVASAGFEAEEAMEVLRIAAQGSAAGLGEVQSVAQVLGGIINSYGKENITAARAADILTAAVTEGSAEADKFAQVLPQVVPTAAQLGVSFEEVAAAIAAITTTGAGAEMAAVGLNQVFTNMLKPTNQAKEALEGVGLTMEGLRTQLAEEGIVSVLRTLEERFNGNVESMGAVFGNVRSLRAAFALLNVDAGQLDEVFGNVAESSGALQGAFDAVPPDVFAMDRAMADMKVTAIQLGRDVLPTAADILTRVAEAIRGGLRWWKSLSDETKDTIINFALFAAAVGPVLTILSKLIGVLKFAVAGVKGLVIVTKLLHTAWLNIPTILGYAELALAKTAATIKGVGLVAKGALKFLIGPGGFIAALGALVYSVDWGDMNDQLNRMKDELEGAGISSGDFAKVLEASGKQLGPFTQEVLRLVDAGYDIRDAIEQVAGSDAWDGIVEGTEGVSDALTRSEEAWENYQNQISGAAESGARAVVASYTNMNGDLVQVMEDGSEVVGGEFDVMTEEMAQAAADARKAVVQEMADMLDGLTNLFDTEDDLVEAWKDLIERMDDPYTEAERKADIFSKQTIQNIRDAITSGDPGLAADTTALVNNMLAQIELMEPGALASGEAVPPALRDGMDAQMQALLDYIETNVTGESLTAMSLEEAEEVGLDGLWHYAQGMQRNEIVATSTARNIAFRTRQALGIDAYSGGYSVMASWIRGMEGAYSALSWKVWGFGTAVKNALGGSLPTEGPLKGGVASGGTSIVESWIDGMVTAFRHNFGQVNGLIADAGGAFGLSPMSPAFTAVGATGITPAAPTGIGGNTYIVNVNGVQRTVKSEQEAMQALKDLGAFDSDGRL